MLFRSQNFTDRTRQRRRRGEDAAYMTLPLPENGYIVIHTMSKEGGQQLTTNERGAVFRLLHMPANATPDSQRASSSKGWGGPFQGTKGDGRPKYAAEQNQPAGESVQLWTTATVSDVAAALDVKLKKQQKAFRVKQAALEVYETLARAGIVLHSRKTNRTGLEAFLEFVTDKGQGAGDDKPMSLMRDKETDSYTSGGAHLHDLPAPRPLPLGEL